MSSVYFISDLHLGHKNICKFRPFESVEEHDALIKENILSSLTKRSKLFILGDIAFTSDAGDWIVELTKYVPNTNIVLGNHCTDTKERLSNIVKYVNAGIKIHGLTTYKDVWLSHCPIHSNEIRKKSLNIHGHCVDTRTEILTTKGWKRHNEVSIGDEIWSLGEENPDVMVVDEIKGLTEYNYTGSCYELNGRSNSMFVTDEHRFVRKGRNGLIIKKSSDVASLSQVNLVKGGSVSSSTGVKISDDLLELYIIIAADGSICNTDLVRLCVHKERKVEYFKEVLGRLSIQYRVYDRGRDTSINFTLPSELIGWRIKGLDWRIVECNRGQADVIKRAYSFTDGNRDTIFTSKKSEVDILTAMFMRNGYRVKEYSRIHGFGTSLSYALSVTNGSSKVVAKFNEVFNRVDVKNKRVWCVSTGTGMWFAKRDGFIFLTGNCHGRFNPTIDLGGGDYMPDKRYFDVSCENVDYKPIRYDQILERLL